MGLLTSKWAQHFLPNRINPARYTEMAVLLATPGFTYADFMLAFGWTVKPHRIILELRELGQSPEYADMVRKNVVSITEQDGLEWLRRLHSRYPSYAGRIPLWSAMALHTSDISATALGVTDRHLRRWRRDKWLETNQDWI
jgi:hypothetical protein